MKILGRTFFWEASERMSEKLRTRHENGKKYENRVLKKQIKKPQEQ